ncbi:hypothetical protein EBR66_03665 [bacterium]|nr:hypothetical protein [bacterium]
MKTLIWVAGGLLVIIISGGWFVFQKGAAKEGGAAAPQQETTSSWTDVLKSGGDHVCTVAVTKGPAQSKGTLYVSGSDVRGDFVSSVAGQNIQSFMIMTGGFVYNWTNQYPQGIKVPVAPNADPVSIMAKTQTDMQGVTYDCKPWTRDASKFTLPKSVQFMSPPTVPGR